jgi:hypothetical protein
MPSPATQTPAVEQSFVWSFRWLMGIAAVLGVVSSVCAALTIPASGVQPKDERTDHG